MQKELTNLVSNLIYNLCICFTVSHKWRRRNKCRKSEDGVEKFSSACQSQPKKEASQRKDIPDQCYSRPTSKVGLYAVQEKVEERVEMKMNLSYEDANKMIYILSPNNPSENSPRSEKPSKRGLGKKLKWKTIIEEKGSSSQWSLTDKILEEGEEIMMLH